ncbi:DNA polymerase I [Gammaproteobacteria bacterium]
MIFRNAQDVLNFASNNGIIFTLRDTTLNIKPIKGQLTTAFVETTRQYKQDLIDILSNKNKHQLILTEEAFLHWLAKLEKAESFAFDTETTGLDFMQAEIIGISFAIKNNAIGIDAVYIPLKHDYEGAPKQLNREYVLEKLKPFFTSQAKTKLAQNIKYDAHILRNHGIELLGNCYDTMLEAYVVDNCGGHYDKKTLVKKFLNRKVIAYEDVVGKKQVPFSQIALDKAAEYCIQDAAVVLELHDAVKRIINISDKKAYNKVDIPLMRVLLNMERTGTHINKEGLQKVIAGFESEIKKAECASYAEAGVFNIRSREQTIAVMQKKHSLSGMQKTKSNKLSTAKTALEEMSLAYPEDNLFKSILEYRRSSSLKTLCENLLQAINKTTGRLHTSYHQTSTITGRLSSGNPNLQNIPRRGEAGDEIRKCFTAPNGYKLISADYSQIELRVLAHISDDENLIKAFKDGVDIHSTVAAEILHKDVSNLTKDERNIAKGINFGIIYGMGIKALAQKLHVSEDAAKDYKNRYFSRYPLVKEYLWKIQKFVETYGYVKTITDRELKLATGKSSDGSYKGVNYQIQGSAAEIIKLAMIDIAAWIKTCGFKIAMTMQIHDELVFEVEEKYVAVAMEEIKTCMENLAALNQFDATLKVPLIVDIKTGANWHEAH